MRERGYPDRLNPFKFAEQKRQLSAKIPVSELLRVAQAVVDQDSIVEVEIDGYRDEDGRRVLKGHIKANLSLECQTTFQPIPYPVETVVEWAPVVSEAQMAQLPKGYEPVLVEEDDISLIELLEEELLLALPIAVNKDPDEAGVTMSFGEIREDEDEEKVSPFAGLAALMGLSDKKKSDDADE